MSGFKVDEQVCVSLFFFFSFFARGCFCGARAEFINPKHERMDPVAQWRYACLLSSVKSREEGGDSPPPPPAHAGSRVCLRTRLKCLLTSGRSLSGLDTFLPLRFSRTANLS